MIRKKHTFHARWNGRRRWWDLYCRRCKTTEELPKDDLPEPVAQLHAQWFHLTQYRL